MSSVPVDLLLGITAIAIDGEIILSCMSEVALLVHAEVGDAAAFGDGARVRDGHADRKNGVLDNVQVLEGGRDTVLRGESDMAGRTGTQDRDLLVALVAAEVEVFLVWC